MRIEGCIIVSTQDILSQSSLFIEKDLPKDSQQSDIQKVKDPTHGKFFRTHYPCLIVLLDRD